MKCIENLDEQIEKYRWIQCNIESKKVASIIAVQEQMVETRAWKTNRGLPVESDKCRICRQAKETVMHRLSSCTRIAAVEYLKRHNNVLMILYVALGMQEGLLRKNTTWQKERWNKGTVMENDECKL